MLIKIDAVIRPGKLEDVTVALRSAGIQDISLSQIFEHGSSREHCVSYRGTYYETDIPRIKLEMLVANDRADEVVDLILSSARTTNDGDDGRIMIYDVADAITIRGGRHLQYVLT